MAEAKQLQVGDVIYRTVRGKVDSKITIVRVNENTAFFDEFANGFQRKLGPNGKVYFSNGSKWDRIKVFYIETPDLIEKWEHKELSEKLANANVPGLTNDQLRRIIAIIEEKPGSVPSDHATGIPTLDRQNQ